MIEEAMMAIGAQYFIGEVEPCQPINIESLLVCGQDVDRVVAPGGVQKLWQMDPHTPENVFCIR